MPGGRTFSTATLVASSTTTNVSLTNPSTSGQSVTFTATVTGDVAGATPTGTVTFTDGATVLATQTLGGAGQDLGTTSFSASTSTALSQTVETKDTSGAPVDDLTVESSTKCPVAHRGGRPVRMRVGASGSLSEGAWRRDRPHRESPRTAAGPIARSWTTSNSWRISLVAATRSPASRSKDEPEPATPPAPAPADPA